MHNWSWKKHPGRVLEQRVWNNLADDDTWLAKEGMLFNNLTAAAGEVFVDYTPDKFADFRLKPGSAALDTGRVWHDDVTRAELPGEDTWKGQAPDAGANQRGVEWTPGAPHRPLAVDFDASALNGSGACFYLDDIRLDDYDRGG